MPPSVSLSQLLTPVRTGDRTFTFEVAPGWAQGRGAFGGLVIGALVRAIEACEPEPERRMRSVAAELVGPVLPGSTTIDVIELRRGNGVSTFEAMLRQSDVVLARATVVLGKRRDIDRTWSPADREPAGAWTDVPVAPIRGPLGPEFAQNFEYRVTGTFPFSSGTEAMAAGWIAPVNPGATVGAAELVALADAWWPAVYSIESAPRPIATIAFNLQSLLGDRELPGDRPLHHRARAIASRDGFFIEHRELWTDAGELVALNQQTFVWIR